MLLSSLIERCRQIQAALMKPRQLCLTTSRSKCVCDQGKVKFTPMLPVFLECKENFEPTRSRNFDNSKLLESRGPGGTGTRSFDSGAPEIPFDLAQELENMRAPPSPTSTDYNIAMTEEFSTRRSSRLLLRPMLSRPQSPTG